MNHSELLHALRRLLPDSRLISLVASFLERTIYRNGYYRVVTRGIGRGSPLSPLLAAVYLAEMDERLEALAGKRGLFYTRFMDDRVILAPTRWKLREAVRVTNECLAELKVEQHPDKTFVGRIDRSFDFLGYQFDEDGPTGLSLPSIRRFAESIAQRFAAGAGRVETEHYVRRWWGWAAGGLTPVPENSNHPKEDMNHPAIDVGSEPNTCYQDSDSKKRTVDKQDEHSTIYFGAVESAKEMPTQKGLAGKRFPGEPQGRSGRNRTRLYEQDCPQCSLGAETSAGPSRLRLHRDAYTVRGRFGPG